MKRQELAGGFIAPDLLKILFKAKRVAKPNGLQLMLHVISISDHPPCPLQHDGSGASSKPLEQQHELR